ncbi:sigma factor-like helix-turn-helix DNA-binding protein [Novosphingobium sp. KN65.2]|uniref:sigma-70 region 4 domain-containing protein n=1 Tax=Novosphingobium sp. KN65.2 TaxID=1478134 RepID=UPI0005DC8587|nr:sigma-70 region 4 domain-containing protein [Novosphingobium sp. KN65.2]CDO35848.1 hypothetical protein SPHV1_2270194 [Novosphingobium sp. KN65.2]
MCADRARLLTAYEAAVLALTPLPRAVFLMCRIDGLTYPQIAGRLAIHETVVPCALAHALSTITWCMEGMRPNRRMPSMVIAAETELFRRYQMHCVRTIRALGPLRREPRGGSNGYGLHQRVWRWLCGWWGRWSRRRPRPAPPSFDEWLRSGMGHSSCAQMAQCP